MKKQYIEPQVDFNEYLDPIMQQTNIGVGSTPDDEGEILGKDRDDFGSESEDNKDWSNGLW